MARPLRIQYAGALYYVTSRGNARHPIFRDDLDRKVFLDILNTVTEDSHWLCHGFCLMANQYHLVIETPEENLSAAMRQLNGVYTMRFNWRHRTGDTPGAGAVINQGTITTPAGGSVYLIGANVSNEGVITTPKGETILAAGQTVNLVDTATPGVKVEITGAEGNTTNLGEIAAEAGRIGMAGVIVRNSGVLNASSAV